jgi:hypothetical protein
MSDTTTVISQIPPAENVNTRFIGFANKDDKTVFDAIYVSVSQYAQSMSIGNGMFFSSGSFSSDKYAARFMLNGMVNVELNKTIPLTSAELNYIHIKPFPLNLSGTLHIGTGGEFTFNNNNGSVIIPPKSIYQPAHGTTLGYYDTTANVSIYTGYLDPFSPDFALSIPCYPMADDNGQRWFLNSLGVVRLKGQYIWMPEDQSEFDFYTAEYTGVLKMPVPASYSAQLPDSIPLWKLTMGRWVKTSYAKKNGNFYTADIHNLAAYNLAIPVSGVYKTIQLRTSAGAPLLNATVKIKNLQNYVAEAQTDWEGNALVFLPANQNLTLEVRGLTQKPGSPDYSPGSTIYSTSFNTSSETKDVLVTIDASLPSIYTINGNAKTCEGKDVTKGEIVLHNNGFPFIDWHMPVVNGHFNAGIIDGDWPPNRIVYTATLIDQSAAVTGTDTAFLMSGGTSTTVNLNTCPLQTNLYMNYSVDGVATSITGDYSHAEDPYLIEFSPEINKTLITTSNSSKQGLQFSTYAGGLGVFTGSGIYDLYINDKPFNYDYAKPMKVTFDRYDLLRWGFVIGSADFWYKDETGNDHHVQANFRVKKT